MPELQPTSPLPVRGASRMRVRYCECDPMGVVHHASFVPWLEIARTEMLRAGGITYKQMEEAGVYLVVASMELKYRRPGRYDDLVEIDCEVAGGSRVKLVHRYTVRVVERLGADVPRLAEAGEDVLAEASTTLVCVGADMRVRALPDWLIAGR